MFTCENSVQDGLYHASLPNTLVELANFSAITSSFRIQLITIDSPQNRVFYQLPLSVIFKI